MRTPDVYHIVERIHATPHCLVFEFAGAGSLALWWLHSVAGSSRTVLEATDRYTATSMLDLLGQPPAQFVSVETAAAMARQAYRRARHLATENAEVLGVACTATIATDYTKRGDHRCAIAIQRSDSMTTCSLKLTKGLRDRLAEETLIACLLLNSIASGCGISHTLPLDLNGDEQVAVSSSTEVITHLLTHEVQTVTCSADGQYTADQPWSGALLSGSFNPLHDGHVRLLQAATAMLDMPTACEIAVVHPDKGQLTITEITRRLSQFLTENHTVILSRASFYHDKAQLFPGCTIVVGYDTAARLLQPHYYGGEAGMYASLETVRANGCRFLVAGRMYQGNFATRADLLVPMGFDDLFLELPAEQFRVDISSTSLRSKHTDTQ